MNAAGKYPWRFAWQIHSYGTADGFGEPPDSYATATYLWGGYDAERNSNVAEVVGSKTNEVRATLRFRQYPAVAPLDKLTDQQSGEIYFAERVHRGDNEVLVEVSTIRPRN